jgi:tetratricopeptide (TPR) repeat protein
MKNVFRKHTALFTFFLFVFFSIAPIYSIEPLKQNDIEKTIREARQSFEDGFYGQAIIEFEKILLLTHDEEILAPVYLGLSLAYFKSGNVKKSEDILRKLFELESNINIEESQFETEYSLIYKKVKAEYWFSIKNGSEEREKEDRKIIAKHTKKPKKKKNKLLPILLIGGFAIALVAMAILFWQEGGTERRGYLNIYNRSDHYISVSIGTLYKRVEANDSSTLILAEGFHEVEISYSGQNATYRVEVLFEQTTTLVWESFDA